MGLLAAKLTAVLAGPFTRLRRPVEARDLCVVDDRYSPTSTWPMGCEDCLRTLGSFSSAGPTMTVIVARMELTFPSRLRDPHIEEPPAASCQSLKEMFHASQGISPDISFSYGRAAAQQPYSRQLRHPRRRHHQPVLAPAGRYGF